MFNRIQAYNAACKWCSWNACPRQLLFPTSHYRLPLQNLFYMHIMYTSYINIYIVAYLNAPKHQPKMKHYKVNAIIIIYIIMLVASNSVCNYTVDTPDSNSPYLKCLSQYSVTKLLYYSCTYTVAGKLWMLGLLFINRHSVLHWEVACMVTISWRHIIDMPYRAKIIVKGTLWKVRMTLQL